MSDRVFFLDTTRRVSLVNLLKTHGFGPIHGRIGTLAVDNTIPLLRYRVCATGRFCGSGYLNTVRNMVLNKNNRNLDWTSSATLEHITYFER